MVQPERPVALEGGLQDGGEVVSHPCGAQVLERLVDDALDDLRQRGVAGQAERRPPHQQLMHAGGGRPDVGGGVRVAAGQHLR